MKGFRAIKSAIYLCILATGVLAYLAAGDAEDGRSVRVIHLDGDIISPVTAEYILSSIADAEKEGDGAMVIMLDTPGGLLESTRQIVKGIMNAKVPVISYVAPKGARAGSAGVFITLASHVAAMAPSTNIGAAHPVDVSGERRDSDALSRLLGQFSKEGATKDEAKERERSPLDDKILNDTKAFARTLAMEHGRNEKWAEDAVTDSVSATDEEALKLGVVDVVAPDLDSLLEKLDGREIKLQGKAIALATKGAKIIDAPKGLRLAILSAIAHPNIAYILMMLGFYGLLFEFTHPGFAFPGIAGAICLILAFFGLQILPTNFAGIALIILGVSLFIAEIKVTSYGLLTVGGIIALFFGSTMLFSSPHDFMRVSVPIALSFSIATLAIASFLSYIVIRSRRKTSPVGREGLLGTTGEVMTWDEGGGKVLVHGEIWAAQSDEKFSRGDKVTVSSSDGMTLKIKRAV
jgi:membrane-bound serine protease (ClpP class)